MIIFHTYEPKDSKASVTRFKHKYWHVFMNRIYVNTGIKKNEYLAKYTLKNYKPITKSRNNQC